MERHTISTPLKEESDESLNNDTNKGAFSSKVTNNYSENFFRTLKRDSDAHIVRNVTPPIIVGGYPTGMLAGKRVVLRPELIPVSLTSVTSLLNTDRLRRISTASSTSNKISTNWSEKSFCSNEPLTKAQIVNNLKSEVGKNATAHMVWNFLRENTRRRLLNMDEAIPTGPKNSYEAFARECILLKNMKPPVGGFTRRDAVSDLLKAIKTLEAPEIKKQFRQQLVMAQFAESNSDTFKIAAHQVALSSWLDYEELDARNKFHYPMPSNNTCDKKALNNISRDCTEINIKESVKQVENLKSLKQNRSISQADMVNWPNWLPSYHAIKHLGPLEEPKLPIDQFFPPPDDEYPLNELVKKGWCHSTLDDAVRDFWRVVDKPSTNNTDDTSTTLNNESHILSHKSFDKKLKPSKHLPSGDAYEYMETNNVCLMNDGVASRDTDNTCSSLSINTILLNQETDQNGLRQRLREIDGDGIFEEIGDGRVARLTGRNSVREALLAVDAKLRTKIRYLQSTEEGKTLGNVQHSWVGPHKLSPIAVKPNQDDVQAKRSATPLMLPLSPLEWPSGLSSNPRGRLDKLQKSHNDEDIYFPKLEKHQHGVWKPIYSNVN